MVTQVRRRSVAVVAAFAVMAVVMTPPQAAAQNGQRSVNLPVVGEVTGGGTFTGALTVTRFVDQNGQLTLLGVVSGILTDAGGTATTVVTTVATPVDITAATCSILHLDLGPLNLNLLGLVVDLNQVVLDITGQTGAGNLLGNLLCAITGLLDSPGGLARLLNQILSILG